MLICWSIKDLSSFPLSPVKLCISELRQIALSWAIFFTPSYLSSVGSIYLSVWSSKWLFSKKFSYQNFVCIVCFLHSSYMTGLSFLPLHDCLTNTKLCKSHAYQYIKYTIPYSHCLCEFLRFCSSVDEVSILLGLFDPQR